MITWNGISGCGPLEPVTFCAQPVPAQQMLIRRPPSASLAALTAASTAASSVTSVATNPAPSSAARAAPFSSLTSAMVSAAPCSLRRLAVASPSPEAPPMTSAPLPSICMRGTLCDAGRQLVGRASDSAKRPSASPYQCASSRPAAA